MDDAQRNAYDVRAIGNIEYRIERADDQVVKSDFGMSGKEGVAFFDGQQQ